MTTKTQTKTHNTPTQTQTPPVDVAALLAKLEAAEARARAAEEKAKAAEAASKVTFHGINVNVGESGCVSVGLPGYRRPVSAYRAAWLRILEPEGLAKLLNMLAQEEGPTTNATQERQRKEGRTVTPTVRISSKGDLATQERMRAESLLKGYGLAQPE